VKIQFYAPHPGDPAHLAEAQVIFEEAGLWGLSLAGISLWSRSEAPDGVAVSLPGRTYSAAGGEERRYGFLRGDKRIVRRFKDTIRAEFLRQHAPARTSPHPARAQGA
jgi:hypothetical protein